MYRKAFFSYQRDNVIAEHAAEQCLDEFLELGRHFLQLGDEVYEELRHVLLFTRVERLMVHLVDLAETARVVRFALTFLQNVFFLDKYYNEYLPKLQKGLSLYKFTFNFICTSYKRTLRSFKLRNRFY